MYPTFRILSLNIVPMCIGTEDLVTEVLKAEDTFLVDTDIFLLVNIIF